MAICAGAGHPLTKGQPMSHPVPIRFSETDLDRLATHPGRIALLADGPTGMTPAARRLDKAMKGALARAMGSDAWDKLKAGEALDLAFPAGLAADSVQIVKLPKRTDPHAARKAGGSIGKGLAKADLLVVAENHPRAAEVSFGLAMRAYDFTPHKTGEQAVNGGVEMMVSAPEAVAAEASPMAAVAEGVFFTRDLVNEPANVLTTDDFAARLAAMQELGLEVEILEEADLAKLGMGALLGVGQGSESPSKVVVMQWNGGKKGDAPFALIGKGVVFDTGGISIKPAGGMEEMTMDMGGAGVVAGVMRTLALRQAKANVVGLVGLVENMPDGKAQRPGDVVTSMKGDTIEVINTDAEGRLVLADVLWYAQERFNPRGMINLATLTGAIIVALGHENTGVFSNNDDLCNAFLKACAAEGEGAWRMPMGEAYDAKLKSRIADMMNVGGRDGGAITAAQFLARFVKPDMPWCHLDIAGTALVKSDTTLAPKGATGWGVMALNRLIRDMCEGK
jgi:leucyl aminopeptidase